MGLPGDNAEGYRLGSPITHTAGLAGKLLLMHGTGDDNVHYQGADALTQIKRHRGKKTEGRQKGSLTHGKKTPEIGVNAHEPRTEKRVVTETPSSL